MQPFGTLLLTVVFFTTIATALAAIYGAISRNETLVRGARYGVYANALIYLAMAGVLWHGYFTHDFANKYIASYSDTSMPFMYLFTSFWGGEKGALLFWATVLCGFSAIAVHHARDRDIAYLGWATGILMLAVFFYDILMMFASNPFETFRTFHGPPDGDGLNPLLQNPTMAIHPPSLLTGFIAFTLPFAFGCASLITGRLDDQWAKDTRKWTLVSWVFLTSGLILGGAWAYEELGWGGFWMWDPVENAGLFPWFTATAFLHSIVIQERRGMLRRWNFTLVCLTFFLTIFGTFMTRSQLIVSIHAFADSKLSYYFLYYMAVITIFSIVLLGWRWPQLKAPERIQSFMSREAFFVLNNVMLVACAFLVIWGTLYSKSGEIVKIGGSLATNFWYEVPGIQEGRDLGEPWFNRVMVPAGLILLLLTAVGPLIPWRRTTWKGFNRAFVLPLALATVPMVVGTVVVIHRNLSALSDQLQSTYLQAYDIWQADVSLGHVYAWLAVWFSLFVFTGIGVEFYKGARVRQRSRGGSMFANMWTLTLKAKRRYGGYIVHIGVAIAFFGFAGTAFKVSSEETPLHLGERLRLEGSEYSFHYAKMEDAYQEKDGYIATKAAIVIMRGTETVPTAEVERVAKFAVERGFEPFHVETLAGSPKIMLRFRDAADADRLREELYLTGPMRDRFVMMGPRAGDRPLSVRLTFRDFRLIQIFPPIIHKQIDEVRRTLGGLEVGRARVDSVPGTAEFLVTWTNRADFVRARALLGAEEAALDDVLLSRMNTSEAAVEIITADTGTVLWPEVRRYEKHTNPTTEVAIWSRWNEDVYLAMRPDMRQSFVNLVAYVNPWVNMLWLGAFVMFLGGVFLIVPTKMLLVERKATARPPKRAGKGKAAGATALVLLALGVAAFLLIPRGASAQEDAYSDRMLSIMKCSCKEAGEVVYHADRTLLDCECPLGKSMRKRVEHYLAGQPESAKVSREAQVAFFETLFGENPSNQRYIIYPHYDHDYLMANTMCSCGCGKMALSQCPMDCPWSPVVKRLFKVWLALGFSRDEARERYLERANTVHRHDKDKFTLDDITLNTEKAVSWVVPVAAGGSVLLLVIVVLIARARMLATERRVQRQRAATAPSSGPALPPDPAPPDSSDLSALDRDLLNDELDQDFD